MPQRGRRLEVENNKIDIFDNQHIIHLKIDGLKLMKNNSGGIISTSIEHLPISLEMFKKSVHKVEAIIEMTINEGYLYNLAKREYGQSELQKRSK